MTASRAVALLGGTFDPVHLGHVGLADDAQRAIRSADVRLVPAADPPHRPPPGASATHRLAMLELAIAGHDGLTIDTREIERGGKSYTVLTLEELRAEAPTRPLILVLGADAFRGLPTWHRWDEILALAHVAVAARAAVERASDVGSVRLDRGACRPHLRAPERRARRLGLGHPRGVEARRRGTRGRPRVAGAGRLGLY